MIFCTISVVGITANPFYVLIYYKINIEIMIVTLPLLKQSPCTYVNLIVLQSTDNISNNLVVTVVGDS